MLRILSYRWNGRVMTFTNVLALLMLSTAVALLTTDSRSSSTLMYFERFWPGGRLDPTFVSWWMLVSALLMFFRTLRAPEMLILLLPMCLYAFVVVWVTIFFPSPAYPPVRAIFWLSIPCLAFAHMLDVTYVPKRHRAAI